MADLMFRSARDLAADVREGTVSARDLVDASLARIDARNGDLNAFVDVFADEARAAADAIAAGDARPFAGVPIAIKNNRPVAGHRLTYGADFLGDYTPDYDH
ncbi:MAG: amidase, partial [Mycobacterium sp.]|nr:amidase [Mycobacterium sp.]